MTTIIEIYFLIKWYSFELIYLYYYRPHNSIYVDIQASVNQSGNVDYTINKLEEAVSTGKLNELSVQPDSFQASVGGILYKSLVNLLNTTDDLEKFRYMWRSQ